VDAVDLLLTRNSAARLTGPAPQGEARLQIFQAALRAPDHARLRPWRFLVIEGEARHRFGEVMASAAAAGDPALEREALDKTAAKALRAPMIVAVVARLQAHPKVPEVEQVLSAGCAAMNMLLACQALGFGAIWRSGTLMYSEQMHRGLGLEPGREKLVGFLYMGTMDGGAKPLPEMATDDYFSSWAK